MQFFFHSDANTQEEDTYFRITPEYVELERHSVAPPYISFTYLLRWDNSSVICMTCWHDVFNQFLEDLQHPTIGRDHLTMLRDRRPALAQLVENGLSRKYFEGAVMLITDPDDNQIRWAIGRVVRSVIIPTPEKIEEFLFHDRITQSVESVHSTSLRLYEDLTTARKSSAMAKTKVFFRWGFPPEKGPVDCSPLIIPRLRSLFPSS